LHPPFFERHFISGSEGPQRMKVGTSFLYFLACSALSTIALHCVRFGMSWLVMRQTGSVIAFAAVFSTSSLVEVYSKPVLAPIADYFNRLHVYRLCVGLASAVMLGLMLAVLLLPFSITLVTSLLVALSLIAGLRDPASAGLVPALVSPDRLTAAQSLSASTSSVVGLGAPMLGALLLAVGGVPAALGAAAIACAAGLLTSSGIRMLRADSVTVPKQWGEYLRTWHLRTAAGIRAVVLTRSERIMAIVVALTNAGLFPFFAVVLPLWVVKGLGASAGTMATIEIAFGIGILGGSTLLTGCLNSLLGRFMALVVGNGLLGAGILMAAFCTNIYLLAPCFAMSGAGFAVFNINASTLRAAATPAEFRSRMAAGVAFLSSCLNPIATQGIGFFIEGFSLDISVAVCGILILISTALLLKNIDAKSLLTRPSEEIVGIYAILYPQAFNQPKSA
jgi:DHA3 family macrolide efflux protein-like MFS transporter